MTIMMTIIVEIIDLRPANKKLDSKGSTGSVIPENESQNNNGMPSRLYGEGGQEAKEDPTGNLLNDAYDFGWKEDYERLKQIDRFAESPSTSPAATMIPLIVASGFLSGPKLQNKVFGVFH